MKKVKLTPADIQKWLEATKVLNKESFALTKAELSGLEEKILAHKYASGGIVETSGKTPVLQINLEDFSKENMAMALYGGEPPPIHPSCLSNPCAGIEMPTKQLAAPFQIYSPEGAPDYGVGINGMEIQPDVMCNQKILWFILSDGRRVRIEVPMTLIEDAKNYPF